ncbi:hypothetical protein MGLY_01820 [Neomoorella glycerini]|uniref:PPM-type phosphatase domain-containing protein n=1 Tax=Neomoorella glycerini TaxID=55779 RepID=A0A6I5ZLV1_9FIRM|nr:hypothetical protein [Moorella glycerini]QGP90870.1 hypothetical protein MGLY_01820 [Moorella glycerini]
MTLLSRCTAGGNGWQIWACWRPRRGYIAGGDFCYAEGGRSGLLAACVDVLGHGEEAHRSLEGIRRELEAGGENLLEIFGRIEQTAFRSRGCALFLGMLGECFLDYILVGNIRGWVINPARIEILPGQAGIVGGRKILPAMRSIQLNDKSMLLVCSDGIKRSFLPGHSPRQLWRDDGFGLTCSILEEFSIAEDDASVLVGRRWP